MQQLNPQKTKGLFQIYRNLLLSRWIVCSVGIQSDSLDVQYSLKDSGRFKSVEQGSPGQKTAALLAFILSYGDEPLISDQPEDDLDNA